MSVSVTRAEPITHAEPLVGTDMIPPLNEGDHLTREEFERRYDAMPHLKKAELIEGVVHVPSPVRCDHHGEPHLTLGGWLYHYRWKTPGVRAADNSSVRLDMGNMPQPDCLMFITPESGGRAKLTRTATSIAPRSSSPKSPPAVPTTTCTISLRLTAEMESANTWSGASSTGRSIGSSCARKDTSGSPRRQTGPCAARSFPVCGSTQPH